MKLWSRVVVVLVVGAAVAGIIVAKQRQSKANVMEPQAAAPEQGGAVAPSVAKPAALPRLVDLGADKCVPCRMMAPILEELKTACRGKMDVEFIDVSKNPGAAESFGIRVIPTQVFLSAEGRELFRHEGFFAKEDILAKCRELSMLTGE